MMMDRIIEVIREGEKFLITSHVRLDGDALGSELALFHLLGDLGKKVTVYNQEQTPGIYKFLPGSGSIVHKISDEKYDAVFILDCSEISRTGDDAYIIGSLSEKVINIDHHLSNGGFSTLSLVDSEASSTGELIYRLLEGIGHPLTLEIAINLYTAILTDTGSFHYSNTGEDTFRIAGEMVKAGVNPSWISEQVYESNPVEKVKLLTQALNTLELDWGGKIASISVSTKMLNATHALPEHTDNFIDFIRAIRGVEVAVFYSEMDENLYKVSFRSKGGRINVEEIARAFGGGGHFAAAACRIRGTLPEIKQKVSREIIEYGNGRDNSN